MGGLGNLFILSLTLSLVLCNLPYGRAGHGHGGRRHHDQNRCHEEQDIQQYEPIPNVPKMTELSPGIVTSQNDPIVLGKDSEINIFPPGSLEEPKVIKVDPPVKTNGSCPEGSGIYKRTGKCHRFSRYAEENPDSPCGAFMEFYKDPKNPSHGDCDCKDEVTVPRPIAYDGRTDKCYWLYEQGPCKSDEWFDMGENNIATCSKRSCPENLPEDWSTDPIETGKKKFWFRYRGKCYQIGTTAYCENPRQKVFYENTKESGYVLKCKEFGINVKALLNGVKELPCAAGHKKSISGECSRVVTFE